VKDAAGQLEQRLRSLRFPSDDRPGIANIMVTLRNPQESPVAYIESLLGEIARYLGLPWNVIRSSTLDVPPSLRAQHRILEIARRASARNAM